MCFCLIWDSQWCMSGGRACTGLFGIYNISVWLCAWGYGSVLEQGIAINLQSLNILSFWFVFTSWEKKAFLGACANLHVTVYNNGFHFNISDLHDSNFVSDDMLYHYHTKQNNSSCNIKIIDEKGKIKCQFSRKLINDRFLASINI